MGTTRKYLFLDTETTRAKPGEVEPVEVIELGWISEYDQFVRRYLPKYPPCWGAMAVHGISASVLADCPPSADALEDVPAADYWIGHNIDFDWSALGKPLGPRRICTLALSRAFFPEIDSHTLSAMYLFMKGVTPTSWAEVRNAHGALQDCVLLRSVWHMLCDKAGVAQDDFPTMYALSEEARIPKKMTFGKFAGQPISAVDRGYANWYRKQPDPDPYLLEAFRQHRLI